MDLTIRPLCERSSFDADHNISLSLASSPQANEPPGKEERRADHEHSHHPLAALHRELGTEASRQPRNPAASTRAGAHTTLPWRT